MALDIVVKQQHQENYLVKIAGRLDTLTAPACEAKLKPLLSAPTRSIILDLSRLDYISSMGLRVILAARKALETHQGQLLLTHMQPPIAKVFEIAKIMPGTFIFESVASADIYLQAIQNRERMIREDPSD